MCQVNMSGHVIAPGNMCVNFCSGGSKLFSVGVVKKNYVIAALFVIARTWKQPRRMDKKAVVHIHNGVLLSH